jgi:hypothetical protein
MMTTKDGFDLPPAEQLLVSRPADRIVEACRQAQEWAMTPEGQKTAADIKLALQITPEERARWEAAIATCVQAALDPLVGEPITPELFTRIRDRLTDMREKLDAETRL